MDQNQKPVSGPLPGRLFGTLKMSWLTVILFAVGAAAATAVFLVVPIFRDSSFERMGVTFEAWIFFAVIIMANCKTPLESAQKTFVFFLISQPLIYLLQVPFSALGWGLFRYYLYWFLLTALTFPAAYLGWYITRRNWLSALILAPVLAYLGTVVYDSALHCLRHFPRLLITALFCLTQIVLYTAAFLPGWKKLVGIAAPVLAAVVLAISVREVSIDTTRFLPDDPILTESAEIVQEEGTALRVSIASTGQSSMIRIEASAYGEAAFTIRDGETEYRYTVEVYEDEGGHSQVRVTPADPGTE